MKTDKARPQWRKIIAEINEGVPVHIYNMPSANSVACGVRVNVGTRDERWPQEAGLAHAMEHMIFQGTEKFPDSRALASYIELAGGRLNAYTNKENTFFYNLVPADAVEKAVCSLSEQMVRPLLPEKKIATEMGNIVEEIRGDFDNPSEYVFRKAIEKMYVAHPLSRETCGTEEAVRSFCRKDFLSFRSHYYHSNNFDFVVAGKLPDDSEKKTVRLFEKHFNGLKENVPNSRELEPAGGASVFYHESRKISQTHIALVAPTGKGASKEIVAMSIFAVMISGGMSFPLFTEVRDKLGLCYTIGAENIRMSDLGCFLIYAATDPDRYKEALSAIFRVIRESSENDKLCADAKQMILGRLAIGLETPSEVLDLAAKDIAIFDKPRGIEEIASMVIKTNMAEISNLVKTWLEPSRFTQAFLTPIGKEIKESDVVISRNDYSATC